MLLHPFSVAALPGAGVEATISDKTTRKVTINGLRMEQTIHGVAIFTTKGVYLTTPMSITGPVTTRVPKKAFRVPNVYWNLNHYPINTGVWNYAPASRRRGMVRNVVRNSPTHFTSCQWNLLSLWQVGDVCEVTRPACRHLVGSKILNRNERHVNISDCHIDTILICVRELES